MSKAISDIKSLNYLMDSLEPKQKLYVEARTLGNPPEAAARLSGYADPHGMSVKLEENLTVRSAIEYSLRMTARSSQITREDVIAGLMDSVHLANSATENTSAWREIGKIVGAYDKAAEEDPNATEAKDKVSRMSSSDLAKMAAIDADFVVFDDEEEKDGTDEK